MMIDAAAAKMLFSVILGDTFGSERLQMEMPLNVEDRSDLWLVKGSPYTNKTINVEFYMHYMFFDKRSAEVRGLSGSGVAISDKRTEAYLARTLPSQVYARLSERQTVFEPEGIDRAWIVLNKGVIGTEETAVDYATVLLHTTPAWAHLAPRDLVATERDDVWHVALRHGGTGDLITLARSTGKMLSGDL